MKKNLELFIAVLLIGYYVYLNMLFGGIAFDKFFLIVAIALIFYNRIKGKLNKKIKRVLIVFTSILLSVFIIAEGMIIAYPKSNLKDDCDYIIVLGAAVKKDTPSLTLRGRLNSAIDYLKKSSDDCYIIVSGGKGSGENISEAAAMKKYLVEHGIDESIVIEENQSTNTYENFKFSKNIIKQHSGKDVEKLDIKIVTTDFHSFRSSILAKRNNYGDITFYSSKSKTSFIPVYYTREFFAIIKMLLY